MNLKKRCSTLLVCAVTLASLAIANLPSLTVSAQEPTEIVSKRTAYEKHYDNHDGTTTALIHSTPLHYLDDGEWRDINNTLMPGQDNNYVNTSNSMKVSLPKSTQLKTYSDNQTNGMFQMNYNGYTLSWVMMDISSEYSAIKNIPEPCILNEQQHSISLKNVLLLLYPLCPAITQFVSSPPTGSDVSFITATPSDICSDVAPA